MTPENRDIPAWAHRERQANLGWIAKNLDVFSTITSVAFEGAGQGAIFADTTSQAMPARAAPSRTFPRTRSKNKATRTPAARLANTTGDDDRGRSAEHRLPGADRARL
jgi:hypothetical protein